jgi:protein TonB
MHTANASLAAVSSAQELKNRYQRNMLFAEAVIIAVIAVAISAFALTSGPGEPLPVSLIADTIKVDILPPPPPVDPEQAQAITIKQDVPKPEFRLPEEGPDAEITEDYVLPSQAELAIINAPTGFDLGGLDGKSLQVTPDLADYIPSPDTFIAVEEQPQKVYAPAPAYPEIARKAGIEGSVWLKVLIWTDGSVRDVMVLRESGAHAGFEEAAVAAARQSKWRPAMQNKQPVALWAAYEVKFRLK